MFGGLLKKFSGLSTLRKAVTLAIPIVTVITIGSYAVWVLSSGNQPFEQHAAAKLKSWQEDYKEANKAYHAARNNLAAFEKPGSLQEGLQEAKDLVAETWEELDLMTKLVGLAQTALDVTKVVSEAASEDITSKNPTSIEEVELLKKEQRRLMYEMNEWIEVARYALIKGDLAKSLLKDIIEASRSVPGFLKKQKDGDETPGLKKAIEDAQKTVAAKEEELHRSQGLFIVAWNALNFRMKLYEAEVEVMNARWALKAAKEQAESSYSHEDRQALTEAQKLLAQKEQELPLAQQMADFYKALFIKMADAAAAEDTARNARKAAKAARDKATSDPNPQNEAAAVKAEKEADEKEKAALFAGIL